jgi:bifunctional DNA-binding transcriptional regulator/antitoxin component of YhaV-PrlF toxin-antitoxin module
MTESKAKERLTGDRGDSKVAEAAVVEYIVSGREDPAVSTISSKNQITLPVHLLREMGLAAGDRLAVSREGNRLILRARPKDWIRYHAGSLAGLYGESREEEDEYLRELRAGDTDRERAIEEAWTGREPPAEPQP